jgi:thiol-disulfide isomerase/thioredoxin
MNFCVNTKTQDYSLQLHLEGIQYDSLQLIGGNIDGEDIKITGSSTDGKNWQFKIPDNIFNTVSYLSLSPKIKTDETDAERGIVLMSVANGDTIRYGILPLDRKVTDIHAQHIETQIEENVPFYRKNDSNEGGSISTVTMYTDILSIPYYNNTEFEVLGKISWGNMGTHQSFLDVLLEVSSKYPDSRYIIDIIATHYLQDLKTKEDIKKIFVSFSETNRRSYWGKFIQEYIDTYFTFANAMLPECETGALEPIIQDSTKINLIIFSASWCKPCHEQIPLLKEIYNDLKEDILITYISLDEKPEYIENWKKLMKREAIPWRSLLAINDLKAIQEKYRVPAIPYALLVYPETDRRVEIIDVREKEDKEKLYTISKQF